MKYVGMQTTPIIAITVRHIDCFKMATSFYVHKVNIFTKYVYRHSTTTIVLVKIFAFCKKF